MLEDEQDTLAAEYVLGTLSAEEREHAEALLSFDPGFEAAVRQWERRLGELNVMVEAVEPPPEIWDKIKTEVAPQTVPSVSPEAMSGETASRDVASAESTEAASHEATSGQPLNADGEAPRNFDSHDAADAIAADLLKLETAASALVEPAAADGSADNAEVSPPIAQVPPAERSAEVVDLATRRARRWRGLTFGFGAIAALLAAYIAVSQVAPNLVPPSLRLAGSGMMARNDGAARAQQDRLVAVLQHQPTAPAFLLTVDTRNRTLIVRRVAATPETGRSYELWLIAGRNSAPRSLGVVGNDEFTQRPLPANVDVDTLRAATYAVSLEPTGGSPSGAPTGPVLFTGKAVESLPTSPSPQSSPSKT
jgi:anti-sigma-K factor RskA